MQPGCPDVQNVTRQQLRITVKKKVAIKTVPGCSSKSL